jgi:ABC-type transport system involved in multi-copper enzyme maturation permease subunit
MNWLVWRQHRKQFLIFGVLFLVFAGLLVPTGVHFWHTYQHARQTCASFATPADPQGNCDQLSDLLFQGDGAVFDAVILGAFAGPILLGLFLGSPLLAREYDEGTTKLAWTQGVSRRKWLTIKLAWILGFALFYGAALTLLVTWWSRTPNALGQVRFTQGHFETQGLMPAAYAVFFTTIGSLAGAWFRKTLVALGVTLGIFVLCMASFAQWIRPHYMTAITVTAPMGPKVIGRIIPSDAWILNRAIVDAHGKVFDSFSIDTMPSQCRKAIQEVQVIKNGPDSISVRAGGSGDPVDDCLNQAGYHELAKYQPSYRYWDFQRIEAGIYLGLSAIAVAATYRVVLKRDA